MSARGPVGYTCPKIDRCISAIEDAMRNPESVDDLHGLVGSNGALEEIRSANNALRAWGADEEDRANDLEKELAEMQNENESLRDELKAVKAEIEAFA